jgi:hypothetical protein
MLDALAAMLVNADFWSAVLRIATPLISARSACSCASARAC